MTREVAAVTKSATAGLRKEARVLGIRAETIAARAHRLYVFGVVFAALFLVGFLSMAIILADPDAATESLRTSGNKKPSATSPSAAVPQATNTIVPDASDPGSSGNRDSLTAAHQAALEQLRSAGVDVKQARERLRATELELFRYLYTQLSEAIAPAQSDSPATVAASSDVSVSPPQESKEILNPQVGDLEQELAQAQAKKSKLLERLMPSHPLVQNVESTIADLEARLEKARQTKIIAPAPGVLQLPMVEVHGDGTTTAGLTILTKAHDLMLAAGRAQRDYDAAVEKEASCWAGYYKLPNVMVLESNQKSPAGRSASTTPTTTIMVAEPSARPSGYEKSGTPSAIDLSAQRPAVALMLVLGLASLGALIAASSARYRQPTFSNVDDIETRLGIPVLGRLTWAGGGAPAIPRTVSEPRWVRRSVLIGEIAIGLAIAAVALLAIADFAMVERLAADPLTGIVQAIAKLRG
jgi:hypothetical protein